MSAEVSLKLPNVICKYQPQDSRYYLPLEIVYHILSYMPRAWRWQHGLYTHFAHAWPSPVTQSLATARDAARLLGHSRLSSSTVLTPKLRSRTDWNNVPDHMTASDLLGACGLAPSAAAARFVGEYVAQLYAEPMRSDIIDAAINLYHRFADRRVNINGYIASPAQQHVMFHASQGTCHTLSDVVLPPIASLLDGVPDDDAFVDRFALYAALCQFGHTAAAARLLPRLGLRDFAVDAMRACVNEPVNHHVIDSETPEGHLFLDVLPWQMLFSRADAATAVAVLAEVTATPYSLRATSGAATAWLGSCITDNAYCAALAILHVYDSEGAVDELGDILSAMFYDGVDVGVEVAACLHAYTTATGRGGLAGAVGDDTWALIRGPLYDAAALAAADPYQVLDTPLCLQEYILEYHKMLGI